MTALDLTAIADACEAGTPLEAPARIVALLADPATKGMADYILQTAAEQPRGAPVVDALRAGLVDPIDAVRRGAAFILAGVLARREDGIAVAALIGHADPVVRLGTLHALANNALPRAGTTEVVVALATAVADDDLAARKEAIWTLYLLGSEGVTLDPALPALERALEDPITAGNAAIALSLASHLANDATRVAALAAIPIGAVQLGVAWGAADAALRRNDLAALEAMFSAEDTDVRRGLGGFLHHARGIKRDISLAGQAFLGLMNANPDNALLQARLFAVQEIIERGPGG